MIINDWVADDSCVLFTLSWFYPVINDFKHLKNAVYMLSSENTVNACVSSYFINVNSSSQIVNADSTSTQLNSTECKQ